MLGARYEVEGTYWELGLDDPYVAALGFQRHHV